MPSQILYKSQKEYFHRSYQKEETPWPNIEPTREIKEFLSIIKKKINSGLMLDLGCGEGRHSYLFQEKGYKVVGIDYQETALKKAIARGQNRKLASFGKPFFIAGDLFSLPLKRNLFDIVLDYGCLHHVKKADFRNYLNILVNLLKPRGYYILSCFSTAYKHYPGEKRKRDWLVHKGHYDRFFKSSEFAVLFGLQFDILRILEEKSGLSVFYHVLMRKRY